MIGIYVFIGIIVVFGVYMILENPEPSNVGTCEESMMGFDLFEGMPGDE